MSESSPSKSEGETLDVSSLRTPDQIAAAFAALAKEEDDVNEELHALLSQQSLLEQRLRGLSSSTPQMLHTASGDAKKLGKVIDFTAKLAEGVAVKVRQLDLAKVRNVSYRQSPSIIRKGVKSLRFRAASATARTASKTSST